MINLLLCLGATTALLSTSFETQVVESTTPQDSIKLEGNDSKDYAKN